MVRPGDRWFRSGKRPHGSPCPVDATLRRGRSAVGGAVRLGLAIVVVVAGAWLIAGRHRLAQEISQATLVLGLSSMGGLLYGLSYLAIEPAIRRRWPWRLTGWNRLL